MNGSGFRPALRVVALAVLGLSGCTRLGLLRCTNEFAGIRAAQDPLADGQSILLVHGISCQDPGWSLGLQANLAREMGYDGDPAGDIRYCPLKQVANSADYEIADCLPVRACDLPDTCRKTRREPCGSKSGPSLGTPAKLKYGEPALLLTSYETEAPPQALRFVEVTWSPIKEERKHRELLQPEINGPTRTLPGYWLRGRIVNEKLADAVAYLGPARQQIQSAVFAGVCATWLGTAGAGNDWRLPKCDEKAVAEAGKERGLTVITHSLGSRVVFDTLLLRTYALLPRNPTEIQPLRIYQLANQLPLLGLAFDEAIEPTRFVGGQTKTWMSQGELTPDALYQALHDDWADKQARDRERFLQNGLVGDYREAQRSTIRWRSDEEARTKVLGEAEEALSGWESPLQKAQGLRAQRVIETGASLGRLADLGVMPVVPESADTTLRAWDYVGAGWPFTDRRAAWANARSRLAKVNQNLGAVREGLRLLQRVAPLDQAPSCEGLAELVGPPQHSECPAAKQAWESLGSAVRLARRDIHTFALAYFAEDNPLRDPDRALPLVCALRQWTDWTDAERGSAPAWSTYLGEVEALCPPTTQAATWSDNHEAACRLVEDALEACDSEAVSQVGLGEILAGQAAATRIRDEARGALKGVTDLRTASEAKEAQIREQLLAAPLGEAFAAAELLTGGVALCYRQLEDLESEVDALAHSERSVAMRQIIGAIDPPAHCCRIQDEGACQDGRAAQPQLVAFSDPSDILSYELSEDFAKRIRGFRVASVGIQTTGELLGFLALPNRAHLNYFTNQRIAELIAQGGGRRHPPSAVGQEGGPPPWRLGSCRSNPPTRKRGAALPEDDPHSVGRTIGHEGDEGFGG